MKNDRKVSCDVAKNGEASPASPAGGGMGFLGRLGKSGGWWLVLVIGCGILVVVLQFFGGDAKQVELQRSAPSGVRKTGPAPTSVSAQVSSRSLKETAEDTELENAAFPAGSGTKTEQVTQSTTLGTSEAARPVSRAPAKVTRQAREPNRSSNSDLATTDERSVRGGNRRQRSTSESDVEPAGMPAIRSDGHQLLREVLGKLRQTTTLPGKSIIDAQTSGEKKAEEAVSVLAENFAPYGRLIKCELVFTVDSLNLQTPIVALVMEDVWWNGKLIIPAGTEAFSKINPTAVRDRIGDDGTWTFVLPEQDDLINGRELVLKGFAIDRAELAVEKDGRVRSWSLSDGSAGLHGYFIDDSDPDKIKLFLATALSGTVSGFAEGLETRESVPGVAGLMGMTELKSTLHNATVNGISQGARKTLDVLAEEILEQIKKNKPYVRVPSGKQFYVFVDQSIDPTTAQVGLRLIENKK